MELLTNHLEANENDLKLTIEQGSLHNPAIQEIINQLKGQIFTFRTVINLKSFVLDGIEDEIDESEVQSFGCENPIKS